MAASPEAETQDPLGFGTNPAVTHGIPVGVCITSLITTSDSGSGAQLWLSAHLPATRMFNSFPSLSSYESCGRAGKLKAPS